MQTILKQAFKNTFSFYDAVDSGKAACVRIPFVTIFTDISRSVAFFSHF